MNYVELERVLARSGCGADAAQCHATLTGLLCAGPALPADWRARVAGGGDDDRGCSDALDLLEQQLRRELDGDQMAFDLLLPDDSESLDARAEALAQWCQGFLVGLTMGGIETGKPLPGDVGEVVSDFATLAQAAHEGAAAEEDEQAYAELCEFVRVGAQLVYEELRAQQARQ